MTKSNTKSASRGKTSKGSKGSVGFVYGGTFRQGLMCVFKSDDKEPNIEELTKYYGSSLNGRYINVENVDDIYQSLLDAYSDSLIKGTETVFKSSTIKDVSNKLKELGEVTKCHLIKSESSKDEDDAEEAGSGDEEEDDKKSRSKSTKLAKSAKSTGSKKSKKEESEDEASEDEASGHESEEEEEEKPVKKGKAPPAKTSSKKKAKEESEDEGSDDEGEKLKKKGKAEKETKKTTPKKK